MSTPLYTVIRQEKGTGTGVASVPTVASVLYMAALVATRHKQRIKPFYQRLLAKGKPKKLALVAAMRKLLTIINSLIKRDELWSDPQVT